MYRPMVLRTRTVYSCRTKYPEWVAPRPTPDMPSTPRNLRAGLCDPCLGPKPPIPCYELIAHDTTPSNNNLVNTPSLPTHLQLLFPTRLRLNYFVISPAKDNTFPRKNSWREQTNLTGATRVCRFHL
ncbi:hypothetical protein SODALDRAFT_16452 [Sodiomyces alkalinus F11]|uniref:Uncharacterized protein n=1 Tax=Sodiomyces alkalinus (strain CBS 110278 / VKM F-3762 / F11) TaxID=1314773 RepID=A0A3N2Q779_SODAK|nr:hypothetical protein SODALDRAFT_16452 [Sodiomyces alkalinus F11]ROT42475.1 hypothetical protein SODALDRAFT_16452 [Sodiomyces alkalinus F11]